MACSLSGEEEPVDLEAGSYAEELFGASSVTEKYNCSFGLNPRFRSSFHDSGLVFAGKNRRGEERLAELSGHPFFMATLFQPQLSSTSDRPHPLVVRFLEVASRKRGKTIHG